MYEQQQMMHTADSGESISTSARKISQGSASGIGKRTTGGGGGGGLLCSFRDPLQPLVALRAMLV